MSDWAEKIPTTGSVQLPPDPRVMDAIGGNHALETALADLVDNSIDAKASKVLIRFVRVDRRLKGLYVVDNGQGMSADQLIQAMRVGGQRIYEQGDLGHFGWGLKAASLSQADSLIVLSRTNEGVPSGMRWLAENARTAFECDLVDPVFAAKEWARSWGSITPSAGTVVRWDRVRTFPTSSDPDTTEKWLQRAIVALTQHLGLIFHRFLERGALEIIVDVEDVDLGSNGPPIPVHPLNPMAYPRSGSAAYPQTIEGNFATEPFRLVAHVWPGRSELPQFRLPGGAPDAFQGFYVYRNGRLIQAGGWNGLHVKDRRLQLARVIFDLSDGLLNTRAFRLNPEKTRVEFGADFAEAVEEAKSREGTVFRTYLDDALTAYKDSSRRKRTRERVAPPGKGFAPLVRKAIESELDFIPGEAQIDIRWVDLPWDVFVDVDRTERRIELNKRYRSAIIGDRKGGLNDAAVVKALAYLLMQNVFRGAYWGSKDKDNIELWQAVLIAAAQSDLDG